MKRLSSYVLEEVKKIKVSLPLYELMKISEVRDTILASLYETPVAKSTPQEAPSSSRNPPVNTQSHPVQSANMVEEVSYAPFNAWETPQQSQGFVGMVQGSSSEPEKPRTKDKRRVRFNFPIEKKQEQTQKVTRDNQVPQWDEKNERKSIVPEERKKPVVFYQGRDEPAPFLVSVRIFRKLLHNCLIDSGASSNVMPLKVCQRLGIVPLHTTKKVTQLDKTEVPVVGELNNIHMQLSADPRI